MWQIDTIDGVSVVAMTSNRVNAIDDGFVDDLQSAMDALRQAPAAPVVLTGNEHCFSAGLNLFELYDWDRTRLARFVERLGTTLQAWFSFPRPTIAAINGHAIAAGCSLALACDLRLTTDAAIKIGLNEVLVGVPLAGVPLEVARHAVPPQRLREVTLLGALYAPREAQTRGLVDELVEAEALLARAVAVAGTIGGDALAAYATVKAQLQLPALERIDEHRARADEAFLDVWFSGPGRRQMDTLRQNLLVRH